MIFQPPGYRLNFIVGTSLNLTDVQRTTFEEERQKYGDIIRCTMKDTYDRLSIKVKKQQNAKINDDCEL